MHKRCFMKMKMYNKAKVASLLRPACGHRASLNDPDGKIHRKPNRIHHSRRENAMKQRANCPPAAAQAGGNVLHSIDVFSCSCNKQRGYNVARTNAFPNSERITAPKTHKRDRNKHLCYLSLRWDLR